MQDDYFPKRDAFSITLPPIRTSQRGKKERTEQLRNGRERENFNRIYPRDVDACAGQLDSQFVVAPPSLKFQRNRFLLDTYSRTSAERTC